MKALIQRLATNAQVWLYRTSEVARFDGIILADLSGPANRVPHFRDTVLGALRLLKATDPFRFARVRRRLGWIVHTTLSGSGCAQYHHNTRACAIDFSALSAGRDSEHLSGWCASTLVHEATHGEIRSRGVRYTKQYRLRIEQLCVAEEQNFVLRLTLTKPDLAQRIRYEFDASKWKDSWNETPGKRFRMQMRRILFAD